MFGFLYLVILLVMGYFDYRYRKIPDLLTSFFYIIFMFNSFLANVSFEIFIVSFSIIYFLNSIYKRISDKTLFGWADVLVIPVWCSVVYLINPIFLIFLFIPILFSIKFNKQPFVTYLCIFYLIVIAYHQIVSLHIS